MKNSQATKEFVYKILREAEWAEAQTFGIGWPGSEHDQRDGFIHLAYAPQVAGVIQRYFGDEEALWLVILDPDALAGALVEEPSSNGELFPHLYDGWQPLAVVEVVRLTAEEEGQ